MTRCLSFCFAFTISATLFAADAQNIVYDFSAVWCGPCQQMAPLVARLEREGLSIRKVDIEKEKELADRFGIISIPTFVVVVDGKEVQRQSGAMTESDLRNLVAKLPANSGPPSAQSSGAQSSGARANDNGGIQLGKPAEFSTKTASTNAAEKSDSPLKRLLPFGRDTKADSELVVRGNDSETGESTKHLIDENHTTDPLESSVRIRVTVAGKVNLGSGTIIDSQGGISKILTCAHIFRGFDENSKIEVDLAVNNRVQPFIARLENFNEKADLGLISVATSNVLPVAAIAQVDRAPTTGQPVAGIGCSGGDSPTREQLQVTAIDRYEGPHNIECTGLPVRGRSGGGLFNENGEVVGVCIAADRELQRGLYSGLFAVHALLDENGLTQLFKPAPQVETQIVSNDVPQSPENPPSSTATHRDWAKESSFLANASETTPPFSRPQPAPIPESVDLRTGTAEVVVIIRDPSQPQQENRVVIIHDASQKFLSYLNGELEDDHNSGSRVMSHSSTTVPAFSRPLRAHSNLAANPSVSLESSLLTAQPRLLPTSMSTVISPRRYVRVRGEASVK